jgi:hypothetical protein
MVCVYKPLPLAEPRTCSRTAAHRGICGVRLAGNPNDTSLVPVTWSTYNGDSGSWVDLPAGGLNSFTFKYTVPPGFDDLSAAVVMDSSPRPPPPPSPPGPPGSSCACPLKPLETIGGSATKCNSTYATMTITLASDPTTTTLQCVPFPNYIPILREMAWSYCWRYDCLPEAFRGTAYYAEISDVVDYNIPLIQPASYQLIHFPAPFGMSINTTFKIDGTASSYNSTVGSLVIGGRAQNITIGSSPSSVSFRYYVPGVWDVDGLSAAVVLRFIPGTDVPLPPSPPSPPPAPPSPPPLPAAAPKIQVGGTA